MTPLIIQTIKKALGNAGIRVDGEPFIEVEIPKEESMGDLSTPVAMSLARALKAPPKKIAERIIAAISKEDMAPFLKIEVAGPGFINFTLKPDFIYAGFREFMDKEEDFASLRADIGKGGRVQVEFVSANPTGPLHLGHGRGAAVGEALSNLLKAAGYNVEKEYYVNDAGRQVDLLGRSVFARYAELLGAAYPFPEEGYKGLYVTELAREILAKEGDKYKGADYEKSAGFFREYASKRMLEEIEKDLRAFGVSFDTWQSEKDLYGSGQVEAAIGYLRDKGLIYEEAGALWFKATAFGDEKDRVIKKSGGEYTYFAADIAYHKKKADSGFGELIDIWGADHHGYIRRVESALEACGYPGDMLKVVLVQMVSLSRKGVPVPMSKRAGEFVTLKEVIEEVGADTAKFIFLTRRPDSHLEFDLDAAREASAENPVYYVQYANARINSIFRHAAERGIRLEFAQADLKLLSEPEELRLIKKLLYYPALFEAAARAREPHRITYYLQELAGLFHPYYNRHRVVLDDQPELSLARLALVEAVRAVLAEGLRLIGVTAPERM
jgi:arginyl-tRNA synthetase